MYIIAEIGQAHEGSLGIAHSYIDALADTGVDAVKFQTHIADAESSIYEPFRKKFSYEDKMRIDYWRRMEFTYEQWKDLKKHCEDMGMEFVSSPFSNAAVNLLEKLGVKRYKVGSGEVANFLMLDKIARTGKPILLSSGLSSFGELDKVFSFLDDFENDLSVLQCTTAYPTKPEEWGLNIIQDLKTRYGVPVGFSDHSGDIFACMGATALGAEILEFHVVFDKRMFGPDSKASLTIDEVHTLVRGVRMLEKSLENPSEKKIEPSTENLKNIFEKSLAVNRDISKNEIIHFTDLEAKKPKFHGIEASKYQEVVGKKVNRNLKKWDFLKFEYLENS